MIKWLEYPLDKLVSIEIYIYMYTGFASLWCELINPQCRKQRFAPAIRIFGINLDIK